MYIDKTLEAAQAKDVDRLDYYIFRVKGILLDMQVDVSEPLREEVGELLVDIRCNYDLCVEAIYTGLPFPAP